MRFKEFQIITESNRGIIGTVIDTQNGKGARFLKPDGTEVKAINSWIFPAENGKARYTPDQDPDEDGLTMENELEFDMQDEANLVLDDVDWVGGRRPSTGFAALIVELESPTGNQFVGRYFQAKNSAGHLFWQVTKFINDCKSIGLNLELKSAEGSKAASGSIVLYPKEVGIAGRTLELTNIVGEIKQGVEKSEKIPAEEKNTVSELIENLGGTEVTCNPQYKANYEVQLGEVAAPIAITRGINLSGQAEQAENILLDSLEPGLKFNNISRVEYPDNMAEKLVDSYLITPANNRIGISSKNRSGGANASISSINETIENKIDRIENRMPDFKSRFSKYLDYMAIIKSSKGKTVAYNLAAEMGIISKPVAEEAYKLMQTDPGNVDKLKQIDNGKFYELTIGYKGYRPRPHQMYNVSYHAVASLARLAAEVFNEDAEETTRFFTTVLEASNMIQVLTTFNMSGEKGKFSNFKVVYPPVIEGKVFLDATSYFGATMAPAGYTFKVDPRAA